MGLSAARPGAHTRACARAAGGQSAFYLHSDTHLQRADGAPAPEQNKLPQEWLLKSRQFIIFMKSNYKQILIH